MKRIHQHQGTCAVGLIFRWSETLRIKSEKLAIRAVLLLALAIITGCCVREINIEPTVGVAGNQGTSATEAQPVSTSATSDVTYGGKIALTFDECISDPLLSALHSLQKERSKLAKALQKSKLTYAQYLELVVPLDQNISIVVSRLGSANTQALVATSSVVIEKPVAAAVVKSRGASAEATPASTSQPAVELPAAKPSPVLPMLVEQDKMAADILATLSEVNDEQKRLGVE